MRNCYFATPLPVEPNTARLDHTKTQEEGASQPRAFSAKQKMKAFSTKGPANTNEAVSLALAAASEEFYSSLVVAE